MLAEGWCWSIIFYRMHRSDCGASTTVLPRKRQEERPCWRRRVRSPHARQTSPNAYAAAAGTVAYIWLAHVAEGLLLTMQEHRTHPWRLCHPHRWRFTWSPALFFIILLAPCNSNQANNLIDNHKSQLGLGVYVVYIV